MKIFTSMSVNLSLKFLQLLQIFVLRFGKCSFMLFHISGPFIVREKLSLQDVGVLQPLVSWFRCFLPQLQVTIYRHIGCIRCKKQRCRTAQPFRQHQRQFSFLGLCAIDCQHGRVLSSGGHFNLKIICNGKELFYANQRKYHAEKYPLFCNPCYTQNISTQTDASMQVDINSPNDYLPFSGDGSYIHCWHTALPELLQVKCIIQTSGC